VLAEHLPGVRRPGNRRRSTAGLATVLTMWLTIAVLLAGLLTARLFLWPWAPAVARVDAVIVLAGDHGDRITKALELMRTGVAPVLVLDGQPDLPAIDALCNSYQPFEIVCLRPEPDSTRTEAQEAGRLIAARGWSTVAVVTTKSHATRAALMFRRCTPAAVGMVATNPPYDLRVKLEAIGHEWLGVGNAMLRQRRCRLRRRRSSSYSSSTIVKGSCP